MLVFYLPDLNVQVLIQKKSKSQQNQSICKNYQYLCNYLLTHTIDNLWCISYTKIFTTVAFRFEKVFNDSFSFLKKTSSLMAFVSKILLLSIFPFENIIADIIYRKIIVDDFYIRRNMRWWFFYTKTFSLTKFLYEKVIVADFSKRKYYRWWLFYVKRISIITFMYEEIIFFYFSIRKGLRWCPFY